MWINAVGYFKDWLLLQVGQLLLEYRQEAGFGFCFQRITLALVVETVWRLGKQIGQKPRDRLETIMNNIDRNNDGVYDIEKNDGFRAGSREVASFWLCLKIKSV